jgi:hypothetical protein
LNSISSEPTIISITPAAIDTDQTSTSISSPTSSKYYHSVSTPITNTDSLYDSPSPSPSPSRVISSSPSKSLSNKKPTALSRRTSKRKHTDTSLLSTSIDLTETKESILIDPKTEIDECMIIDRPHELSHLKHELSDQPKCPLCCKLGKIYNIKIHETVFFINKCLQADRLKNTADRPANFKSM